MGARDLAAQLLGVSSIAALAQSQVARAVLPDGRVETHEYGRQQHSSASAGGVLIGLSGAYGVPDSIVAPLSALVGALIDDDGRVRSHDGDTESGDSTWAQSQILLGLLLRPHLVRKPAKLDVLIQRLMSLRDAAGGWPLRAGESPALTFTFYPVLALSRAHHLGLRVDGFEEALRATAGFVDSSIRSSRFSLEERLLGQFVLERISMASDHVIPVELIRQRGELIAACWRADTGIQLQDQLITIYRQPVWHSITWRPLLYLCLRQWISPLGPIGAVLGAELVNSFDRDLAAWTGPAGSVSLGSGSSWASALALRGTTAFAHDLRQEGASIAEFEARVEQLSVDKYTYDVAISFAGADRSVAETISRRLQAAGLRVFYDRDYQHALLGEDLAAMLHHTYFADSKFAVIVVSREFLNSKWAGNWELKAVLARMQQQHDGYVLPYVMEDVSVPGLNPTVGYVAAADFTAEEFADLVVRKFRSQLRSV
jgi:hypothetical protein